MTMNIPHDKITVMEKTLYTPEEARERIASEHCDPDSGMEYLHGLEVLDPLGNKFYKISDVERFINR